MRKGVVVIGLISAGLVIGGTIWYFNSRPKKSDNQETDKKDEDIPQTETTTPKSSPAPTKTTTVSGGGSTETATSTNLIDEAKAKFGSGARVKNNQLFAPFNSNKNIAVFYSNGRFVILKIGEEKKGTLLKGSFKDGGLTLMPDKGKVIKSSSAWTNLNMLPIKK
jgi:hypothetical protein